MIFVPLNRVSAQYQIVEEEKGVGFGFKKPRQETAVGKYVFGTEITVDLSENRYVICNRGASAPLFRQI